MTRWGRLAVLRRAAGYTQEQLATAMDVDRTTIHRWENGKATPRPWQMPKLARLLKVSRDELRSIVFGNPDADGAPQPGVEAGKGEFPAAALSLPGPGISGQGAASNVGDVGRQLDTVDALISDWASVNSKTPASALALWVTEEDVVVAEGMLGLFRQLDHTHGARQHWRQVSFYIDTELEGLLRRPAVGEQVARQRAQLTAGFCELAGYQAVDIGNPDRAQEYYQRALALTTAIGDQSYGAYLVAVNLGHLALHRGNPETALRWASSARAAAGTAASPATRAAITAVVARANARMLRESEATQLILEAEKLLDAASAEDEPTWIRYFTHAYLADEAAHCLHDLGRAPDARIQLADALGGVGKDKVRRRAIDAALLAATWLRSGDVDQACAVARDAVVYTARTGSGRCVERVAGILADLQTHADYVAVRELREFARAVLPDADRLAVKLAGGS
ncbi:helix-turn-helix transcriptional regulator [Kitasatospora sp. NPDC059648]|uniref:helix-turn-helix transcriptional regulator n=1 Tax=Kitasatospora sp. NPDC059648 TaxID=3346894 RepID=UPI0036CC2233